MSNKPYRHVPAESYGWLNAYEVAAELELPYREVMAQLDMLQRLVPARLLQRKGAVTLYPADTVEVLRGLLGYGHRSLEPPERDWLSRYLMTAND